MGGEEEGRGGGEGRAGGGERGGGEVARLISSVLSYIPVAPGDWSFTAQVGSGRKQQTGQKLLVITPRKIVKSHVKSGIPAPQKGPRAPPSWSSLKIKKQMLRGREMQAPLPGLTT